MWSQARGLLSPGAIFGGGGGGGGSNGAANKKGDNKKLAPKSKRTKQKQKKEKGREGENESPLGSSRVSRAGSEASATVAKIQSALNSSADGSSGYTSQLSGGGASSSFHQLLVANEINNNNSNISSRNLRNADRNNNNNNTNHNGKAGEQVYHSLASAARLPPMVPMMIDDDDEDEGEDEEDVEQAIELDLEDDYGDSCGEHFADNPRHLHHRHQFDHQQQQQSLRLIDGLRQQHEMRYNSGSQHYPQHMQHLQHHNHLIHHQHSHHLSQHHQQLDDKLSLANSIMFHEGGGVAHSQRHFSLPSAAQPPPPSTTSRGTTLLAYAANDDDDDDDDDDGADSDAANLSRRAGGRLHTASSPSANNHPYPAYGNHHRDVRPHLDASGGGRTRATTSNSHLTANHHHQHSTPVYYQPSLVSGSGGGQLDSGATISNHQASRHQHHNYLLAHDPATTPTSRQQRAGSFLQFPQSSQRSGRAQPPPPPVPPAHSKPHAQKTSLAQRPEQLLTPSYKQHNARHEKLASSTKNQPNNKSATQNNGSTFRSPSSMTNRMHAAAHTEHATSRHYQQQQQQHYLAAPDASGDGKQQVRRSRSNQQLAVSGAQISSPTRPGTGRVPKSASGGGGGLPPTSINNDNNAAAAAQHMMANANLAAIASRRDMDSPLPAQLEIGCCGKMAKFLLFMANLLFWSAGIALGAWGILALVDDHKYNLSQLLVFDPNTRMSLFQLLSWSFITLGCATILVGVCGCSAMFKNSRWILGLYIFLILAIFALDLATGLLAMIFQERLVANVRLRLVSKLRNEYGLQASFTAAIDYIQTRYECCGLDGHFDYDQSLWRLQRLGGFEATVARTCCHLRNTFDDQAHVNPRPVNESMCQSTDVRFHQSYRYRRGCLDDLERLIRHKIWTFTIGCGIVGGIILLSLALATCFCRSIPSPQSPSAGGGGGKSGGKSSNGSASRKSSSNRVHQQALAYAESVAKSKQQGHHSYR